MASLGRLTGIRPKTIMTARSIDTLKAPAERAERRLRAARALSAGAKALVVTLVAVAVILVLRKTGTVSERSARVALVLAALGTLVTWLVIYLQKVPRFSGAVALDRYHHLSDRLSSALAFSDLPAPERTPFMDAAIDDALAAVPRVDPKKAVPFRSPRELPLIAGLTIVVALISLFEVRKHVPNTSAKTIDPVDVTADDLDAMRDFLKDMQQNAQSDDAKDATREFNQLIEDLAAKRLDRTEAFRRMQSLEDKLLEGRDADAKSLEEALQKIGEEMKKSELTKPAGEALDNKNLVDAEKQLHELAKKLREGEGKLNQEQLQKMREALKAAAADQAKRQEALEKKREEAEKSLLQEKQKQADAGAETDQEKSLFEKKERELERLQRDEEQAKAVGRQLDRLDRELDKAAEDLMKDMGLSAQDLDQSAEDINRMAQEQMTDEEKEQLRQKLEELRELMRQQGQGGQQQMARLRRFQQHAQGKGQGGGQGQQGQGQDQDGQEGQEGQDGQQGQNGQNGQSGQGQNGQQGGQGQQGQSGQASNQGGQGGQQGGTQGQNGQGGQQGGSQGGQGGQQGGQGGSGKSEVWVIGPSGQKILMMSQGQGQGSGSGNGNGGQGTGESPGSHGYGSGHDDHVQGQATNMKTGTEDTQVAGQDTGQGGSRSEVIQGAAERGFANKGYTRVYREYHTVAEDALEKDEIPGGYRFYVRRYFELIRPRDEQQK